MDFNLMTQQQQERLVKAVEKIVAELAFIGMVLSIIFLAIMYLCGYITACK